MVKVLDSKGLSKVCSNFYGKIYTQPGDTKEVKKIGGVH